MKRSEKELELLVKGVKLQAQKIEHEHLLEKCRFEMDNYYHFYEFSQKNRTCSQSMNVITKAEDFSCCACRIMFKHEHECNASRIHDSGLNIQEFMQSISLKISEEAIKALKKITRNTLKRNGIDVKQSTRLHSKTFAKKKHRH